MKKDYTPFWIVCLIVASLFGAVAVAEFCQWLDRNPEVKEEIGL